MNKEMFTRVLALLLSISLVGCSSPSKNNVEPSSVYETSVTEPTISINVTPETTAYAVEQEDSIIEEPEKVVEDTEPTLSDEEIRAAGTGCYSAQGFAYTNRARFCHGFCCHIGGQGVLSIEKLLNEGLHFRALVVFFEYSQQGGQFPGVVPNLIHIQNVLIVVPLILYLVNAIAQGLLF